MSDGLTLGDAVQAKLEELSEQEAELTVYDSEVPFDPDDRYAVHYPGISIPTNDRHAGIASKQRTTGTITCVGKSRQQAAWVADRVISHLTGFWPDPSPGSDPLKFDPYFDTGINKDDSDPNDIRFTHVLRYILNTTRS